MTRFPYLVYHMCCSFCYGLCCVDFGCGSALHQFNMGQSGTTVAFYYAGGVIKWFYRVLSAQSASDSNLSRSLFSAIFATRKALGSR